MPVVKGGVWTNIEDEILKASVSKYGLNQWARVSSLLARKTPKQCKARWAEWLDPGIRKVEWSKEEDEKLLHLAKLMPTQWRTIAPIVGRTATQCLERYQKLLDEAEARENEQDGLSLGGPTGGETSAPSADDVRRLRPGELDPDPESKPARPDTIDLDEDEKEMLSEARARLANTQGKKAKRKARERQLEESRRLALLQKRRELKASGINIKVTTKKKGQMDYNADIPFEKAPAPGFHDTQEEMQLNEKEREAFDPRKQQLANKRKGDGDDQEGAGKRQKKDKDSGNSAFVAAAKAAQLAKLREAEQSSRRRALVLPAPQVSDVEMDDIIKMGLSGERVAAAGNDGSTRGLIGDYSNQVSMTPMRTPRAPQEEDRIANEIRNARLRTATQSALLGGDNAELGDGTATTGYEGAAPSKQVSATPNPYKQANTAQPSATPFRTPRDNFRLNQDDPSSNALVSRTPADLRLQQQTSRASLRSKLSSLPRPKETEWELELPSEQDEGAASTSAQQQAEDAAVRDARERQRQQDEARAELRRQSRVVQRGLPRPALLDVSAALERSRNEADPIKRSVGEEMAALMARDAQRFGGAKVNGKVPAERDVFSEEEVLRARREVVGEAGELSGEQTAAFGRAWEEAHARRMLPGLAGYGEDEVDEVQLMGEAFDALQNDMTTKAEQGNALEKKLLKIHGGYIARARTLRGKIVEAAEFLARTKIETETARAARLAEDVAMRDRLETLRGEVQLVSRLEREGQDLYRERREELESISG